MTRSVIGKRLAETFSNSASRDDAKDYLAQVRTNLGNVEQQFQKLFMRSAFLAVAFVFFSRAGIAEFTFGPLKIKDLSLIQKMLPAILAYTYYELAAAVTMRRLLTEVHDELVGLLYDNLVKSDLEYYLRPHSPFVTETVITRAPDSFLGSVVDNLTFPLMVTIVFAPLAFLVYAFITCFAHFGLVDPLLWVILTVSVFFLFQGFLFFVNCNKFTNPSVSEASNKLDAGDG